MGNTSKNRLLWRKKHALLSIEYQDNILRDLVKQHPFLSPHLPWARFCKQTQNDKCCVWKLRERKRSSSLENQMNFGLIWGWNVCQHKFWMSSQVWDLQIQGTFACKAASCQPYRTQWCWDGSRIAEKSCIYLRLDSNPLETAQLQPTWSPALINLERQKRYTNLSRGMHNLPGSVIIAQNSLDSSRPCYVTSLLLGWRFQIQLGKVILFTTIKHFPGIALTYVHVCTCLYLSVFRPSMTSCWPLKLFLMLAKWCLPKDTIWACSNALFYF